MARLIRSLVTTGLALYAVSLVLPGFVFSDGFRGFVITALILTLVGKLIKPVVNLVLLPINLVTLGLFRWAGDVLTLYLTARLSSYLTITGFSLNQWHFSPIWSLILAAFLLSLAKALIRFMW